MAYNQLTEQDRYVISHLSIAGYSYRETGRRIGRHHTTISREIKRNGPEYPDIAPYWYYYTHPEAIKRRHQPKHHRRQVNKKLVDYVESKIRQDWPPEVIAARIRLDFPDDRQMRISHETIYFWMRKKAVTFILILGGDIKDAASKRAMVPAGAFFPVASQLMNGLP